MPCVLVAGGALLALLGLLFRWLRADGDLTLLWAEWRGKKPGKAARQQRGAGAGPAAGWGRSVRRRGMAACGEERGPQGQA